MNTQPVEFIKMVAAEAANNADAILRDLLPAGRRQGKEWLANNPTRDDRNPSLSINVATGQWNDPATTDSGGDLVSLAAYLDGTDQYEAAKRIGGMLGISQAQAPDPARAAELAKRAEADRIKRDAVKKIDHDRAAKLTQNILQNARRAPTANAYAIRKGINPAEAYEATETQEYECRRDGKPERFTINNGDLLVPVSVNRKLATIQVIPPSGAKKLFLTGGNAKGGYLRIGQPTEGGRIYVCEGYATGRSIYEATGACVVVAFSTGNMPAVINWLAEAYPKAEYIIAADNDSWNICQKHRDAGATEAVSPITERPEWCKCNPGLTAAAKAARELGVKVAYPTIERGKDWNDVHKLKGLDEVRAQIANAATVGPVSKPERARAELPAVLSAPVVTESQEWQEPEPLPEGLLEVSKFDSLLLPATLRPWADDIAERIQCPPDFVGVTIMSALGSVIGRKVGIRPQEKTDWTVTPNQWAMVIGRPGIMKSPAMDAALSPLKMLGVEAATDHKGRLDEYLRAAKVAQMQAEAAEIEARKTLKANPDADVGRMLLSDKPAEDEPTLRRFIANDTSAASLGELLRQNSNGILVFRDELVSLLKSLDREDNAEARGFYLTGWNGDSSYTFDRIGRGLNLCIDAVCISLLGSTQPGRIAEYLRPAVVGGSGDDGLIQRFGMLVWPDKGSDWRDVDRWPETEARRRAFDVFRRLNALDAPSIGAQADEYTPIPYLRFDAAALEAFREWRGKLESKLAGGELSTALEAHFSKYRKLVPGLALILHLANAKTGAIGLEALLQALAWAEYLETHAKRAYASVTLPEVDAAKAVIARLKRKELANTFTARDVYRKRWAHLADPDKVKDALRLLDDYGWLAVSKHDTAGRTATIYTANPRGLA